MHDICTFAKNPCGENLYSAKREQFMCVKNPCFAVVNLNMEIYKFRFQMYFNFSLLSPSYFIYNVT